MEFKIDAKLLLILTMIIAGFGSIHYTAQLRLNNLEALTEEHTNLSKEVHVLKKQIIRLHREIIKLEK